MAGARVSVLDVNVLVALFFPDHVHHDLAHAAFADLRDHFVGTEAGAGSQAHGEPGL